MKKILSFVAITFALQVAAYAQPSSVDKGLPTATPSTNPGTDGFANGQVTLANNTSLPGTVKDNLRKKGEVILQADGKKTKYKAGELSSAQIGNTLFITSNYTFYEVIYKGKSVELLRKASEPQGLQYNGADAAVVSSEGKIDDLFVRRNANALQLLTKKNYKEVLGSVCAADVTTFDIDNMKKAVEACDK